MLIGPHIPEIQLFEKLWKSKVKVTGNVKVQSHDVSLASYRLTSLSFHVNRPSHSWDTAFSKCDLENLMSRSWVRQTLKVITLSPTFNQFTSISFHVNRPSHSWDTTFSKFDLENPRWRAWVRWKLKVTTWVQHIIDSHLFRSMSIGHPLPEIRLFQNLTLKIQGQGHGWGQSWKAQSGCNILLTHIPFVPCQSALPFLRYIIFKIWPWTSRVKVKWPWSCTTTGLDNSIELRMV